MFGALLGLQNEALAHFESGLHRVEHFVGDQTILVRESGISWILSEGIGQTIADCETFEVEINISGHS